jgi:hypothetical protein
LNNSNGPLTVFFERLWAIAVVRPHPDPGRGAAVMPLAAQHQRIVTSSDAELTQR